MKLEDAVRLVSERIDYLLETKPVILIALDGNTASGKSTLAHVLQRIYIDRCNLFHTDDYFLRLEQRTEERYAQPGGNFDRERFEAEILKPLSLSQSVAAHRYNCNTFQLEGERIYPCQPLNIIEGSYSMHPELERYYDFSVYTKISPAIQHERICARNPETKDEFFTRWIPLEEAYFSGTNLESRADLVFEFE